MSPCWWVGRRASRCSVSWSPPGWGCPSGPTPPAGAGVVPEATMPSGDLVGDPPARADPVADDQWADDAWDGWDEPLEDAEADLSATVSERPFAGPTTGETDLWGAPSRRGRRRAAQGGDGDDDASMDPPTDSDQGDGEGTSPRLVLALIGAALAVVGIAGAALAAGPPQPPPAAPPTPPPDPEEE